MDNRTIVWHEVAIRRLQSIHEYIAQDSKANAKKVVIKIKDLVNTLNVFPEKYSKVQEIDSNLGNFRSVPIYSYRIIYEITDSSIIILDIFHTSQNPEKINDIVIPN